MKSNFTESSIFLKSTCPSDEILLTYTENTLNDIDKRNVEVHLIDCEICSDVVEGIYKFTSPKVNDATIELNKKIDLSIHLRNKKTNLSVGFLYKIAAVFLIVLSGFLFKYYLQEKETKSLAELKPILKKDNLISPEIKEPTNILKLRTHQTDSLLDDKAGESKPTIQIKKTNQTKEQKSNAETNSTSAESVNKKMAPTENDQETVTPHNSSQRILKYEDTNTTVAAAPKELANTRAKSKVNVSLSKAKVDGESSDVSNINYNEIIEEFQKKNYIKVLAFAEEILKINANDCEAIYYKGSSYAAISSLKDAENSLETLLQLDCKYWTDAAKIDLALLYKKTDRKEIGKDLLKQAILSRYSEISEKAKIELLNF